MRFRKVNKPRIAIFFLAISAVLLYVGTAFCDVKNIQFYINGSAVPTMALNGMMQSLAFIACIIMVLVDYKRGFRTAIIICSLYELTLIIQVLRGNFATLAGLANGIIQIAALIIIKSNFKESEINSITDKVTGLTNRYGFEDEIIKKANLYEPGNLAYVKIEGFLNINSTLGRKRGDEVLRIIGERIISVVAQDGQVFKIEGAEYAVWFISSVDYMPLVQAIISAVEEVIIIRRNGIEVECYVTAYAGTAENPDGHLPAMDFFRNADLAVNHAIQSKKSKIAVYDEQMMKQHERKKELEVLIKEGLQNGYFFLMYQPQFTIKEKKLRGFEALVRMKLPDGSVVSPGEFIPIAEESDLIMDIDDYVLSTALSQFRDICRKYHESISISINVSAQEIGHKGFAQKVIKLVEESEFPASCLEVEITEYTLAEAFDVALDNVSALRAAGIMVALDDFGTGYSSLSQVMKLPISLLKIDKSLVDGVKDSELNRDFISAIIYMGHLMGCEVVSEGVEELEQLDILKDQECDFVQGFVWGRPMSFEDASGLC